MEEQRKGFLDTVRSFSQRVLQRMNLREEKESIDDNIIQRSSYETLKQQYLKELEEHTKDSSSSFMGTEFVRNLPEAYRNDKDIMLKCIEDDIRNFDYVSDILKDDKEFILRIFKDNHILGISGGEETDGEIVDYKGAVILNNVSDRLRDDKEVCLNAISSDPRNIEFISDRLKNSREFIVEMLDYTNLYSWKELTLLTHSYSIDRKDELLCLPEKYRDNKDITLNLIEKNIHNLKHVSDRLKNENDFIAKVLNTAVGHDKDIAKEYLKESLKDNKIKMCC